MAFRAGNLHESRQKNENLSGHSQRDHFSKQLAEIEKDVHMERISLAEAAAAKAELAREVLRFEQTEGPANPKSTKNLEKNATENSPILPLLPAVSLLSLLFVVGATFGAYFYLGNPSLPANPLASRTDKPVEELSLDAAVALIEERLRQSPEDVQGWKTVAPVYMRMARFQDASNAFAKVNELSTPTAETLTDQAEALLMLSNGHGDAETMGLLTRATLLDENHVRSRFYLAGQASEKQDWPKAELLWSELLELSTGAESWVSAAERGLEIAQAGGITSPTQPNAQQQNGIDGLGLDDEQKELVQNMVSGLASRLYDEGGTVEEWTRLVRSRLVLTDRKSAQTDYELGVLAHPNPDDRMALDALALEAGLSAFEPVATEEE